MPKNKFKKKFYLVKQGEKNFGAFPFTKDGKEKALTYIAKLKKNDKGDFKIAKG